MARDGRRLTSPMSRYIAFLRAINVGKRYVKMDRLRAIFGEMGFANVETFIASGNVIFDAPQAAAAELERAIESGLQAALGFRVDTFLRPTGELAAVAAAWPFAESERAAVLQGVNTYYIAFLAAEPDAARREKLQAFANEIDEIHVDGREVHWLCRHSLGETKFSAAALERVLGMPGTLRNARTVERMAKKYA